VSGSAEARLALLALSLLALAPSGRADGLYGFEDAHGVLHFSDSPAGDSRYRRIGHDAPPRANGADRHRARPAPATLRPQIDAVARTVGLDPHLIHAVVQVESNFDPAARSPKGALGLMQLMPATAARYGVTDPLDPADNLLGGARYLKDLLRRFDDNLALALAAYNAGEGAVARHDNRIPPYPETRAYVPRVLALLDQLQRR
jgi:soluble lytic murein transglycosylase